MCYDREKKLILDTPVARIALNVTPLGVTRISFVESEGADRDVPSEAEPRSHWELMVRKWFDVYFSGQNVTFSPLLQPTGTTFQENVWNALRTIPRGQTRTYGEVAAAIERRNAARAVGQACGQNQIPILIPCHRVIPAGNGIGEYSGPKGVKKQLLEHESQKYRRDTRCT